MFDYLKAIIHKEVYSSDLIAIAKKWSNLGSNYLHLVDLDGAKVGECINIKVLLRSENISNLFIQIEVELETMKY